MSEDLKAIRSALRRGDCGCDNCGPARGRCLYIPAIDAAEAALDRLEAENEQVQKQVQDIADEHAALEAENARLTAADLIFWRLLFAAHGFGYGDDGELQNTQGHPFIDFKRDTAEEIESKVFMRNHARLTTEARKPDAKKKKNTYPLLQSLL